MSGFGISGAALLTSLFMAAAAQAETTAQQPAVPSFPACSDHEGTPVRYAAKGEVNLKHPVFIAGARYLSTDPISKPAIVYDPAKVDPLSAPARAFLFAHECYHLNSGDAMMVYQHYATEGLNISDEEDTIIEDNADCDAARRLRYEYGYSAEDMKSVHSLIRDATSGREDQDKRIAHVTACFEAAPKVS